MLDINTKAPSFNLPDSNGKNHDLFDYAGKWVLLYFYPKDDTPDCTKEACSFRGNFPDFKKLNLNVIGISADSIASHKKFAEKYGLNFILLSDPDKTTVKAYEAGGVFVKRVSYLINPAGLIYKAYSKVDPSVHAEEVLKDLPK